MKKINKNYLLLILLLLTLIFRLLRVSTPNRYIFDEVYHTVTARGYSQGIKEAYNPFSKSPEPNTAYDWLHPPLAKLIQATSIKALGDSSFSWRLPSAIFGTLSVFALYYLGLTIFKKKSTALLAATLLSLDGLHLTMSRVTMNDVFVTTFIIFALTFFYKVISSKLSDYRKNLFLTGLFTGLALATKWSALFLFPIYSIFLLKKILKKPKKIIYLLIFLLILPLTIYLLSYSQYFLLGYTLKDFYALHQQIYWYQTGLTATHDYQAPAWQWPLLIKPVWFHVEYQATKIANIYNLGNPVIFWGGLLALFYTLTHSLKKNTYILISYFFLFFPWLFSPRILFLHHYLPALSLLCLVIANALDINKKLIKPFLFLTLFIFIFFYPINTAIPIPNNLLKFWFWLPTWK